MLVCWPDCFLIVVLCILVLLGSGVISAVEYSVVYDRITTDSRQPSSRFVIHNFFSCSSPLHLAKHRSNRQDNPYSCFCGIVLGGAAVLFGLDFVFFFPRSNSGVAPIILGERKQLGRPACLWSHYWGLESLSLHTGLVAAGCVHK